MNKRNAIQEREDFLAGAMKAWMKFQVIEKNILKKKELDQWWIDIIWVNNFKFKRDDILVIDEVWKRSVKFHVVRKDKDKTNNDEIIRFEFSKIIFIQRFESFTDLDNVIDNVITQISEITAKED